jgi:hypothetical protein
VTLAVGFGLEGGDHCLDRAVPLMAERVAARTLRSG